MKYSYIFTVELRKIFSFLFLIFFLITSTLILVIFPYFSPNVVGYVEASVYGIKIVGYVFNYYNQGMNAIVKVYLSNELLNVIVTHNGSFCITTNISYFGEEIKIVIITLFSHIDLFVNPNSAFSYITFSKSYIEEKNFSVVVVDGGIISVPPTNIIPMTQPNLLFFPWSFILILFVVTLVIITIFSYFYLSPFPREEYKGIMRIVGEFPIYMSKLIASLIFSLILSIISFPLLTLIMGIYSSSLFLRYILNVLLYTLGVYGIAPFGTRNLLYYSSILAIYTTSFFIYNEFFNLFFLLIPVIGFMKIKSK